VSTSSEFVPLKIRNSIQNRYSRFARHPVYIDPITKNKFIGVWNPPTFPAKQNDVLFHVSPSYAFRPDSISYFFYDTPLLAWVICYVNDISNPLDRETGLYSGRIIRVPDISTIITTVGF